MHIKLLDHLIISPEDGQFNSLADEGYLPEKDLKRES
jgi:hypothetical protein